MNADFELKLTKIKQKLKEGLAFIAQREHLSPNEGLIKFIYSDCCTNNCDEDGIEIYAPHLIPNQLSETWSGKDWGDILDRCLEDLTYWVQIEKEAPVGAKILLDFYA